MSIKSFGVLNWQSNYLYIFTFLFLQTGIRMTTTFAPERRITNYITFTFACSILQTQNQKFREGSIGKHLMSLHKIVRNRLSNVRQICDNYAHPSYDVRNEIRSIFRKLSGQFAAHLRQPPPSRTPPSWDFRNCVTAWCPLHVICVIRECGLNLSSGELGSGLRKRDWPDCGNHCSQTIACQ